MHKIYKITPALGHCKLQNWFQAFFFYSFSHKINGKHTFVPKNNALQTIHVQYIL